jgi:hypothetical protein
MPPQTRASMTSAVAWEKLRKYRLVPLSTLNPLKAMASLPKKDVYVTALAASLQFAPDG